MNDRSRVMVLSDGDVPSLVALTHAIEQVTPSETGDGQSQVVVAPLSESDRSRSIAIQRQASLRGARIAAGVCTGEAATDILLAAGRFACKQGVKQVVWPVHAGISLAPEAIDLDRAAAFANTAVLVERLLSVELGDAPTISTPFVDLCDRRMADLAVDVGLIPGDVWWTATGDDARRVAAERWGQAFEASGVRLRGVSAVRERSARG